MYPVHSLIEQVPQHSSLQRERRSGILVFILASGAFILPLTYYLTKNNRVVEFTTVLCSLLQQLYP